MVASMMRLIAAAPFALPVVKALVLHEQVSTIPSGWSFTSAPDKDAQIVLQVALAQQNIDQLESRLSSISTPGSSSYGQYLDHGDIDALFGPSDASKNAVKAWLSSSGINDYTVQLSLCFCWIINIPMFLDLILSLSGLTRALLISNSTS